MSAAAIPPGQERGAELPRPVLQAMLICENAIREAQTNKVTLVGIFDRMGSDAFPLVWGHPVYVYARITDAQGDYPIRLELVRLDDEQAVGSTSPGAMSFGYSRMAAG